MIRTLCLVISLLTGCQGEFRIPGLSRECYTQPGDVLFGAVFRIMRGQNKHECSTNMSLSSYYVQRLEAVVFAIREINKDPDLLPNITIGFVVLDSCGIDTHNIGQGIHLLPNDEMVLAPDVTPCDENDEKVIYDIIAMIGTGSSGHTLPLALTMTTAQIPLIGALETSDELRDKSRFGFFIPFSLSDSYQSQAILELLSHHNWTYFTLIYDEGLYGENGAKEIQENAATYGVCFEQMFMMPLKRSDADRYLEDTVYPHLSYSTVSRVIVLFTGSPEFLFESLPAQLKGRFIYIGSEAASYIDLDEAAEVIFMINLKYVGSEAFERYYRSLTPSNNAANPWWRHLWSREYSCTWDAEMVHAGEESCVQYENTTLPPTTTVHDWAGIYIDAVYTVAHGLHLLLNRTCPEAFSNSSLVRGCINGPKYLSAIKNVSFDGLAGRIEFDDNGDIQSEYILTQYSSIENKTKILGSWHSVRGLQLNPELIDWRPFNDEHLDVLPLSVCSYPCEPKQYIIRKEVECCWECRYCRDNEVLVGNGTGCEVCEENKWPDEETATDCQDISPTYLHWTDNIGLSLTILATVGIMGSVLTAALLMIYRDKKLIKASSRELIAIILLGIVLTFLSSVINLVKPTTATCFLRNLGFAVSVTVIYAPLLTKTIRVFRIFQAGQKGVQSIALISTRSQLVLTAVLLLTGVVVAVVVGLVRPSVALTRMPVLTERYSELICTLPPDVLITLLLYNLLLLITCAAFGFLTRKLPENFNESWFIFISVVTTVFIWIVFLPTYFTTFYAYQKTALLATCLLLNGYITLICLFIPKIYAACFVEEAKMKFISNTAAVGTTMTDTSS